MANLVKYLLTVDADTGAAVKLEKVGESGELIDADLGMLAPPAVAAAPAPSVVIHVYGGGVPQVAAAGAPGGSIVHQPAASIVHAPGTASIVHQPGTASIVHAPASSIVHQQGAASIVHQPASSIVHADTPAPDKPDSGTK